MIVDTSVSAAASERFLRQAESRSARPAAGAGPRPAAPAPDGPDWLKAMAADMAVETPMDYLARHSHSFRYAARFLPPPYDVLVAEVYAFCRFTDDLVDRDTVSSVETLRGRLDDWRRLARAAYAGQPSGFALLDRPLMEMGRRGIPFDYASDLIDGVAMDLGASDRRYATLDELDAYSYRVASVVGLWLTRLVGVHDAAVLERAAALGHAMQLTNILRDVGEDWRNGRLYLPLDVLSRHGVTEADIARAARPTHGETTLPAGWPAVVEELMAAADARYARALPAVVALPRFFRAPVAVSGLVYRDIHTALRANGYDNFHRRAHTSSLRKVWLGIKARVGLARGTAAALVPTAPAAPAPEGRGRMTSLLVSLFTGMALAAAPASQSSASRPAETGSAGSTSGSPRLEALQGDAAARARAELARVEAALRGAPRDFDLHLARLRVLHVLSVSDESLLPTARSARAQAESVAPAGRGALLSAYRGALDVVEARHGFWPRQRLTPLRRGLPLLDSAVSRAPSDPEIRYLRLTSAYYLPFFLGRSWSVREDFDALAKLLPAAQAEYPADWYLAITGFVLDKGDLGEREARALRAARAAVRGSAARTLENTAGNAEGRAARTRAEGSGQPDFSRIP